MSGPGDTDARTALARWLRRLMLRSELSERDAELVLSLPGTFRSTAAGRDFVRLGERVAASCIISRGLAARFGQNRDGLRQLTAVHLPGDAADLHSAVLPESESALTALSDVTIYQVPHEAVHQAAQASPALARAFWRDCTVDASIAGEWLLSLGRRDASSRLAHLFCEMALRSGVAGAGQDRFELPMTQEQLGDALGLTAVHVNRMLRLLREAGIAAKVGTTVEILDWARLAEVGDFDDAYLHLRRERPATGGSAPPTPGAGG